MMMRQPQMRRTMDSGPLLQRRCACGGSCQDCATKTLLRRTENRGQKDEHAPPIVHDVLRSQSRPLDRATRGTR
ncbi:MAG: hypothetical protein QOH67_4833 [Hyphomicrobiales bacterium]|jgi:hypothetical protein|nr:hypothetical protein [Hyphomicrobiales bacterium]